MLVQNEIYTVKSLQYILDMSDIVILYDANLLQVSWVGHVKDLPLCYLNKIIVNMFSYNISIPSILGTTVYYIRSWNNDK